ncbi:hypothetical protein Misp01_48810 [Microtetraspora sp. NBRC 13810]|nr:hypothetical protein Misp01_48810 [Microtetraspora sp. NBRC 13810]
MEEDMEYIDELVLNLVASLLGAFVIWLPLALLRKVRARLRKNRLGGRRSPAVRPPYSCSTGWRWVHHARRETVERAPDGSP